MPRKLILPLLALTSAGLPLLSLSLKTAHAQKEAQGEVTKKADKDDDDDKSVKKAPKKPAGRWQVSRGVDPFLEKGLPKPTPITIKALNALERPADMPVKGTVPAKYLTGRIAKSENSLWLVRGTVVSVAAEHDGDYRLIIADEEGNKICCILPDPMLVPKQGRVSPKIMAARKTIVDKFHPTFDATDVQPPVPVEIMGFGYFGRPSPDENPSPIGYQLQPVVSVKIK